MSSRDNSPKRRKLDGSRFVRERDSNGDGGYDSGAGQPISSIPARFRQQQQHHNPRQRYDPSSRSQTPRGSRGATPHQTEFDGPEPNFDENDVNALDRDWYGGEENGHTFGDETHNPFGGADN